MQLGSMIWVRTHLVILNAALATALVFSAKTPPTTASLANKILNTQPCSSHSVWKSVPLAMVIKEVCASHANRHVKRVPGM